MFAQTDTFINVPYQERMEAKALGAKWNAAAKERYVPQGGDLGLFGRWPEKSVATSYKRTQNKNLRRLWQRGGSKS